MRLFNLSRMSKRTLLRQDVIYVVSYINNVANMTQTIYSTRHTQSILGVVNLLFFLPTYPKKINLQGFHAVASSHVVLTADRLYVNK